MTAKAKSVEAAPPAPVLNSWRKPVATRLGDNIRRVAIIFSGGPAPGANAVISAAATSFMDDGRQVIGFFHGYSNLEKYHPITNRLLPDVHYRIFDDKDVSGQRNARGIVIGTARANPGKGINCADDLKDPKKNANLQNVYNALVDLNIDALISIGGDDTLRTANFLYLFQKNLPPSARRIHVVHLPKTIDNDYFGIDFTFGFFTAVDVMAKSALNLRADAQAASSWFIIETMGRKAGWISYGVGIAGEADMVVALEDLDDSLLMDETVTLDDKPVTKKCLNLEALADRIVDLMLAREQQNKHYGTIVLAEGLAEKLPQSYIKNVQRDEFGHIALGRVDIGKIVAVVAGDCYSRRTGIKKKLTGIQLGYEARCAPPHAFDVMLGSQLGIGAFRALVEEGLTGHLVSAGGQLELHYEPFENLINPQNLTTEVRLIKTDSDFHKLARFLESHTDKHQDWTGARLDHPSM